jgi:hypothetical protein
MLLVLTAFTPAVFVPFIGAFMTPNAIFYVVDTLFIVLRQYIVWRMFVATIAGVGGKSVVFMTNRTLCCMISI